MNTLPDSKELHKRASESAKETRGNIIKLATGSIGVLFFIATRGIKPALLPMEQYLILSTIVLMVSALGYAIWFGFSDAQWSYWWGVELDEDRSENERDDASKCKSKWHKRKSLAEKVMLIFFVLAGLSGGLFVLSRTF